MVPEINDPPLIVLAVMVLAVMVLALSAVAVNTLNDALPLTEMLSRLAPEIFIDCAVDVPAVYVFVPFTF